MDKNKLTKLEKYWILYDIGNSAFVLLVSTIIPIYFKNIASANGVSLSDSTGFTRVCRISLDADRRSVRSGTRYDRGYKRIQKAALYLFHDGGRPRLRRSCPPGFLGDLSGNFRDRQSWIL